VLFSFWLFSCLPGGLELPLCGIHDCCKTGGNTPVILSSLQVWRHDIANDPASGNIRQNPLQPGSNLDSYLTLFTGNDQNHPVPLPLLPYLPGIGHPDGKIFHNIPFKGRDS